MQAPSVREWVGTPGHRGSGYSASISPAPAAGNPRLYEQWFEGCWSANGDGGETGHFAWESVAGHILRTTTLNSGCYRRVWQFVAGWIGHPVVRFHLSIPKR